MNPEYNFDTFTKPNSTSTQQNYIDLTTDSDGLQLEAQKFDFSYIRNGFTISFWANFTSDDNANILYIHSKDETYYDSSSNELIKVN